MVSIFRECLFWPFVERHFLPFLKNGDPSDPDCGKIITGKIFDHAEDTLGIILSPISRALKQKMAAVGVQFSRTINDTLRQYVKYDCFWIVCCNFPKQFTSGSLITSLYYRQSLCRGISAGIVTLNLSQTCSITRLTGSFVAIWDGLQCFVLITSFVFLYRYHIE